MFTNNNREYVGCRDAIEDGVTGFLCRSRDSNDLAEKMINIIEMGADARVEMGREGRKKMEREFDVRIISSEYLKILDD